jgi:hypothetical protein
MNLRAIQTEGAHGMNAYSQLDAAVWREYVDDLPRLQTEAAELFGARRCEACTCAATLCLWHSSCTSMKRAL